MFKYIFLTGLISGLFIAPVYPETYTGGVSTNNLQADIKEDINPVNETGVTNVPIYLTGTTDVPIYPLDPILIRVPIHQHKRSAIGVNIRNYPSDVIWYIDPNSDLYGKVQLGDRMLTIDGVEATKATKQHRNYGTERTIVTVLIEHKDRTTEFIQCQRHPVEFFSNAWEGH